MAEGRRRNKAARAKAFDDEWLRLTEEARIAFDDGERCHSRHLEASFEQLRQNDEAACATLLAEECRRNTSSRAKGFDDAFLRLKEEARIAFDDEERRHKRHLRVLIERLRQVVKEVLAERTSANDKEADGRTRALPPTDTTATANGEDTQRPVTDDATPRRVMAESNTPGMWRTSDDTSSSPELTTAATLTETLSSSPRPTTYVGAVLSNMGERAHVTPLAVAPSPQSLAEPHPSAADGHLGMVRCRARPRRRTGRRHRPRAPSPLDEVLSSPPIPALGGGLPLCTVNTQQTVRRRYRPRRRHGRRHQPQAPNPSCDEAPPSHPHPTLGGTSTPTIALPTRSARAMYLLRSESSSISPFSMMSSSPSSLPFNMSGSSSTNSKGGFLDFFRDGDKPVPPRKRSRQHHRSRRTGRRHGPRAPDLQEHLLSGRRHWPRAPNQSTCHGWE